MKTPEDFLKEAIGEIRYSLDGSVTKAQLKWAMEEYAKYYHETEVKKLNIASVSGSASGAVDTVAERGMQIKVPTAQEYIDFMKKMYDEE